MNIKRILEQLKNNKTVAVTVNSSNIATICYTPQNKTLSILFNRKTVYQYSKVPVEVFLTLIQAESVGKAFQELILNKYDFKRLANDGSIAYIVEV